MSDALEKLLSVQEVEEYSELGGGEYLFHEAVEEGKLSDVLAKFPRSIAIGNFIQLNVLQFDVLADGWKNLVLADVQSLLGLLPEGLLPSITGIMPGHVNYDTDEMFALRATMGKIIRRHTSGSLSGHERAFLNDFFYGVDFTHWTKWAIILHYTDTEVRLPNLLRAMRNDINFSIDGTSLIYELPKK